MHLYYKGYKHLDYPINVLYEAINQKHVREEIIDPQLFYNKKDEINELYSRIISSGLLTITQICLLSQFYKEKYFMNQVADILGYSQTYLVKEKRKALDKIYNTYGNKILNLVKNQ